jgi:hypothetical protein
MSKKGKDKPQGQPQDVIGGGIDNSVVEQLIAREKLVSSTKRDNNHLLFYNSNGAWARIVSSINTITKEETEALATGEKNINDVVGNKNLAYNNVIMGGTVKQATAQQPTSLGGGVNQSKHNPINIDMDGYASAGDVKDSAYHNYESLGHRPTPGINSVSVKSKGTYGSLREAEVNVTVWTLEDLEMMQALYLRPGFTILLEWGHSLQLDSKSGEVVKDIQYYRKFLRNKVPKKTIQNDLKELTFDSSYNYDSMSGYISNFNWSFREDGGYDCMIKIISSGTVLESIAVTFDTSNVYPVNELESWEEDKGKKERRSIYHKLFVELEHLVGDPNSAAQEIKQNVVEFGESLQGVQVGVGVALTTGNTDLLVSASAEAAENFGEIFTGDDERARRDLNDVATATGRALLQDPTFKAEYDKVIGDGYMFYRGTKYSWTKEKPLSQYNEEKVVPYLRKKFGKYGLKFTETGWGTNMVNITVKGDASRSEDFDLNTLTPQGSRKETYNIMDYIVENGKLPGN